MKPFLATLVLFLLAFTGLAIGIIIKGKGPRSSCGHARSSEQDCRCESDTDSAMQQQTNCHSKKNNA